MTKKQEEAIEYLKESVLVYKNTIPKISNAIETVLSMLKEKDELYNKALNDLVKAEHKNIKQDKITDLMAEQLAGLTIWNNEKEEPIILTDKEEIKQYFKKVSDGDK